MKSLNNQGHKNQSGTAFLKSFSLHGTAVDQVETHQGVTHALCTMTAVQR